MIEFYQLEQLITIAKEGTLSKAAQQLLISQPALTRSLQRLELDLGLQLFDRKKNKISLNDTGELAVMLTQKLLDERDQMVTTLHAFEKRKSILHIGSCAPMPIVGLRYVLANTCPDMLLEDTLDSNSTRLLDGLHDHEFSIIVLPYSIEDESYVCVKLFEEHLYLSVPPAHPLALFPEITFEDLDGESVLLLSRIGFWNEICLQMIPHSHLLIQEDQSIFHELTKASALPNFKSNITMQRDPNDEHRVSIPINDVNAHVTYYAVFFKAKQQLFQELGVVMTNLDWSKTLTEDERRIL